MSEERPPEQPRNRPRKLFPTQPPRLTPTNEPPPPTQEEADRAYKESLLHTVFRRTWRQLTDLGNLKELFRREFGRRD